MKKLSQNEKIRRALERGEKITPMTALKKFHCFRLAARIETLRRAGMPIKTRRIKTREGVEVAQYSL